MAQLTIVTEHDDDTVVLRIAGALDLAGGDLIEESARPFVGSTPRVLIDLSEVQFIDSSGLGALIALQQQVVDAGGELALRDPSDPVRRVLDVTQTADVFGVDASPR